MSQDYKMFMSLSEPATALEISGILTQGNIPHKIHDSRKDFDPAFGNSDLGKEIALLLLPSDFAGAEKLISEKMELNEGDIDPDHFLFGFSDEELKEVVKSADEWHPIDVKLAQHILAQRGISLTNDEILTMRKDRIEEMSKPEATAKAEVLAGYFFGSMGGFVGIFIGYYLMGHKKTLPDGSQVYNYSGKDRKNGRNILIISFISTLIYVAILLIKK